MPSSTHFFPQPRFLLAIFFSLIAALCFSILPYVTKLSLSFTSVNQVSFFRNISILLITLTCISFTKKKQTLVSYLKTTQLKTHIIRFAAGFASVTCFIFSLKTISSAEANVLNNLAPMFLPLVAFFWKRIPINYRGWPGILVAFLGTAMLMQPHPSQYNSGLILALLSGIIVSVSLLAQQFANYSEPFYRSLFYYSFFSTVCTGTLLCWDGFPWEVLLHREQLLLLLMVGVIGFGAQLATIVALKFAPASFVTPFLYLSTLIALGLDVVLAEKGILLLEVFGVLCVLIGLYLHFFLNSRKEKKEAEISPST
jgi:drug/metabolite transporter (DMT)-like permease